jgi:hypothetical protein
LLYSFLYRIILRFRLNPLTFRFCIFYFTKLSITMQTNLFSDAFPLQEKGLVRLHAFAFEEALDLFKQARELNTEIPNNTFYAEIAAFCQEQRLNEASPSRMIVDAWEMKHQEQAFDGCPSPMKKFLFRLFATRLLDLDEFDAAGKIPDASSFFHISACALHLGEYETARKELANLLAGDVASIPARYWGYYGDAALRLRKAREANLGYLRLLAANPFDVDWSTFYHSDLQNLFNKLRLEHDLQQAYGSWPFYAWMEGLIEIPASNRYIQTILREKLRGLAPNLQMTPLERLQRFSLYVFHEQSTYNGSPDIDLRMKMQQLDEKRFREYLTVCGKR